MSPETALLEAVQAALLAAPPVAAFVGEQVFDTVPGDDLPGVPPYIYAGPFSRRRFEDAAWTVTGRFFAVSTAFGRKQAWAIAEAAILVVDMVEIELPAPFHAADVVRVSQAGDVLNQKGGYIATFFDVTTTIQRIG